jgi:hypothetical protein
MNRYLAPIFVGLLLVAGCTTPGQSPTSDPFLVGKTRIPPPGTGEAAGRTVDPAYSLPGSPTPPPSGWQPSGTASQPAGTPIPSSVQPSGTPGFASRAPDARGLSAGSLSTASSSLPPVTPTAGPPPPTSPAVSTSSPGVAMSPGAGMPPPSNGATYRGVSLRGSRPAGPAPDYRSAAAGGNPADASLDNRAPRPLDEGGAASGSGAEPKPLIAAGSGNAAGSRPPPGAAAQPTASGDPPGRVTDVGDLPTAL